MLLGILMNKFDEVELTQEQEEFFDFVDLGVEHERIVEQIAFSTGLKRTRTIDELNEMSLRAILNEADLRGLVREGIKCESLGGAPFLEGRLVLLNKEGNSLGKVGDKFPALNYQSILEYHRTKYPHRIPLLANAKENDLCVGLEIDTKYGSNICNYPAELLKPVRGTFMERDLGQREFAPPLQNIGAAPAPRQKKYKDRGAAKIQAIEKKAERAERKRAKRKRAKREAKKAKKERKQLSIVGKSVNALPTI